MNIGSIISFVLPYLLQLLNDPAFQAILKQIEADLHANIAAGVPAAAAGQKATGLLATATALHLTGNPVADFQSLIAGFKLPAAGTFTS